MYSYLLHSHLLQSLGNAIVHSLWQSLLLLLLYKGITISKKNLKPAVKHNLSAIFVFITFGWFLFTFQANYFLNDAQPVLSAISEPSHKTPYELTGIIIPSEISSTLSLAYLVLLSFLMTRLIFSIARILRIHTADLIPVDTEISVFTKQSAHLLKISRKVTVWVGKNIDVPATIGFLKPVILLPAVCFTHLTPTQIEAIIIHELSHIRRNDYVLNLLLVIIETLLFFNPAVYIFMKSIRSERENCCDDLVLNYNYEPLHYAKALLTLSKDQKYRQMIALNASSRGQQLIYRIKRITGGDLQKPAEFSGRIVLFTLITILFLSFSFIHHQPNKISDTLSAPKIISQTAKTKTNQNPPSGVLFQKKKTAIAYSAGIPKKKSTIKEADKQTVKKDSVLTTVNNVTVIEDVNDKSFHDIRTVRGFYLPQQNEQYNKHEQTDSHRQLSMKGRGNYNYNGNNQSYQDYYQHFRDLQKAYSDADGRLPKKVTEKFSGGYTFEADSVSIRYPDNGNPGEFSFPRERKEVQGSVNRMNSTFKGKPFLILKGTRRLKTANI